VPVYERALGLRCEHREEVPSQKVRTAFFDVGGGSPGIAGADFAGKSHCKFLADRGEGIHHIAFRTDDITGQLAQGRRRRSAPDPRKAVPRERRESSLPSCIQNRPMGVLTELCATKASLNPLGVFKARR